jgi:[pyruvate, water dikinase]-phosphate phosphotransferase / [pyruvate, water dikinase] kinase
MVHTPPSFFHLHLVSDSTGETLVMLAKAAAVQYPQARAIEHIHPLIRTSRQLTRVLQEIEQAPGIVLYTLVNTDLSEMLAKRCAEISVPVLAPLQPVMATFESFLGAPQTPTVAGQHILDASYFKRIEAMNFTMAHDDGRLPLNIDDADIVLLGISRTSKTPTSIYLAQRGYKTTNLPLVPTLPFPEYVGAAKKAFVVGLIASAERISDVRRNRALTMGDRNLDDYVDRSQITAEIAYSRRVCAKYGWPVIDVTRRSIEETAASILKLMQDKKIAAEGGQAAEPVDTSD